MATSNNQPCRLPVNLIQTFHLVWLDEHLDENNQDYRNSITKLRRVANRVNTFTDADECIDFITDATEDAAFMIVSQGLGQLVAPVVKDTQIKSIYILNERHDVQPLQWTSQWKKIRGVYRDIESICQALRKDSNDWDRSTVSIGIAPATDEKSGANKDVLHCSFMYTKMLKEVLLTIQFDNEHIQDFLNYCRAQLVGNDQQLKNLEKFQREYSPDKSIWWYTSNNIFYSMLNRALRLMDIDIIMKMSFFLCDLHNHITKLHSEQFQGQNSQPNQFIVYRGQGLSQIDFDQLQKNQGGLLSFNNFLSTSYDRELSLCFAKSNTNGLDIICILFRISVDPTISIASFAHIAAISNFDQEEEVLFSMHSVFRIGAVTKLAGSDTIYEVELTLTSDDDLQLRELTEQMQKEMNWLTGWHRLGSLLMTLAHYSKAEELYETLLRRTTNEIEKYYIFHNIGMINTQQGRYKEAICFYQKSLEISKQTLPANHPSLAISYSNIGLVYASMGDYSKALEYYEKSLDIQQKALPANHPSSATLYSNIGSVHKHTGDYSKALEHYEKSLDIRQKCLPANHPDLAISYNNIGLLYNDIGHYSKVLEYYKKSCDILKKILPEYHPLLATAYNNIALMYYNMDQYSEALEYYEKSLDIRQKTLSLNHPDLATSYNSIGGVYRNMDDYSKALEYHEKSLDIQKKTLPANHPNLALTYNHIGGVCADMSDYSKALECYEKSLHIQQKILPTNHRDFVTSYNNIAVVSMGMGDYFKALEYYEKSLDIRQKTLPANHPDVAAIYNHIGSVYAKTGDYSKALEYYERSLNIRQQTFPANHPLLATSYGNIGLVYYNLGNYSKALECCEKSVGIRKQTLPENHIDLGVSYNNIGMVYKDMGDYPEALEYFQGALDIFQRTLPLNHPMIKIVKERMESLRNL